MSDAELIQWLWGGAGLVAALGVCLPRAARRASAVVLRLAGRLGRAPRARIGASFALGCALPMAGAYLVRWPHPGIHDEFAYILMAETFAQGRCAMPTHPHWEFFETFHVMQRPTYAAKYPPVMGLPLAVGILLFDEPRVGLWLQSGLLAAAVAWMLLGWLPRRWAVLGTLLCIARFCATGVWVQTFYYSAIAGVGGALVLGALGRMLRAAPGRPPTAAHGAWLGVGLAVLAGSRPFEGLVLAAAVGVALLAWVVRRARARALAEVRAPAAGAALVLVVAAGLLAHYDARVTGDPWTLPYLAYDAQYSVYPPFLFQEVQDDPGYRHEVLREFAHGFQKGAYGAWGDARAMGALALERFRILAWEFAGWPLWGALLLALLRPKRVAPAVGALGAVFAGLCTTSYLEPRYAAPTIGALFLAAAQGLSNVRRLPVAGRRLAPALVPAYLVAFAGTYAVAWNQWQPPPIAWFGNLRAGVVAELRRSPGRDLVFVRLVEGHQAHHEWVVNGARIDDQDIVWARDLGPERNAALLAHYPERKVWRLVSGDLLADGPSVTPYE